MSKRLPYFQFEPAEYLAGDIMFCSFAAQGIFNSICSIYWQKDCQLNYSQLIKRLGNEDLIQELISENIIKIENDTVIINFLDEQYLKATQKSNVNSNNGKAGALKRWGKNSENIATPLNIDSESIALREDKIREEEIKEYNINNKTFVTSCLESEQWLETICINKKITTEQCKEKLKEFEQHLIITADQKQNKKDFQTHFSNWLVKDTTINNLKPKEYDHREHIKGI